MAHHSDPSTPEEWLVELLRLQGMHNAKVAATAADGRPLKYNEGKTRLSLVDPFFIRELAKVFEYGLTKYAEGSWRMFKLEDAQALIDPAMRHTDAYRDGEYYDKDSGLPHLMSAAWNLMLIHYHTQANTQR